MSAQYILFLIPAVNFFQLLGVRGGCCQLPVDAADEDDDEPWILFGGGADDVEVEDDDATSTGRLVVDTERLEATDDTLLLLLPPPAADGFSTIETVDFVGDGIGGCCEMDLLGELNCVRLNFDLGWWCEEVVVIADVSGPSLDCLKSCRIDNASSMEKSAAWDVAFKMRRSSSRLPGEESGSDSMDLQRVLS